MKRGIVSLCITAILSIFVFSASAQEQSNSENVEGEFVGETKDTFSNNWFISVGTGANLLWGEQDQEIKKNVISRFRYGGGFLTFGKWFNPAFGIRLQGIYAPVKGFNYIESYGGYYTHPGRPGSPDLKTAVPNGFIAPGGIIITSEEGRKYGEIISNVENWKNSGFEIVSSADGATAFVQAFNYWSVTFDLMTNLVPLFRGYYKESVLDIIPFAGGGLLQTKASISAPKFTYFTFKFGVRPSFNVNSKLAVYAEAQGNITSREFDGYIGDELFDMVFHLNVGLQYTFNKNFTTSAGGQSAFLTSDEINYLNEKINNNRRLIDKHQTILERQQDLLDRLNNCCDESGEAVTHVYQSGKGGYLPEYIRFALNSSQIQFTEDNKFRDVIDFLNANPKSKLLLVGYADRKTGTSSYNFELSRKRVETVSQELIRRGIDAQRLILEWKGDKEQPYAPNDWNRVVVMVARN
jgi:outer membrane protein OmpA-like peptidoglycan-associated protein